MLGSTGALGQSARYPRDQAGRVKGLADVVLRAGLQGVDSELVVVMTREYDHCEVAGSQLPNKTPPLNVRKFKVDDRAIERLLLEDLAGFGGASASVIVMITYGGPSPVILIGLAVMTRGRVVPSISSETFV